jgi:hypothetical protein
MSSNRIPMSNVHLIYTCIVTNKALNKESARDYAHVESRLEQFLSSLHSMKNLSISSANFYIEIDDEFSKYIPLIESHIENIFDSYTLRWHRLQLFQDWVGAKNEIPPTTQLVLLQSNFDHIYTLSSPIPFFQFCDSVVEAGPRSIGEITHWPEAISEFSRPWSRNRNVRIKDEMLIRSTNLCVGTSLITFDLFCEWWQEDFTGGSRIVRPDNPFGPSVQFPDAKLLVPFIELFRHLDGYSHVGIGSKWAQPLSPCCLITDGKISHSEYLRETFLKISSSSVTSNVLPDLDEKISGLFLNRILTAGAHRIDFALLFKIGARKDKKDAHLIEYLKYILILLRIHPIIILIPRYLFENLIIGSIMRLHRMITGHTSSPRNNMYCSKVMSLGFVRGSGLIFRITTRKLVKIVIPKGLHRHFN